MAETHPDWAKYCKIYNVHPLALADPPTTANCRCLLGWSITEEGDMICTGDSNKWMSHEDIEERARQLLKELE